MSCDPDGGSQKFKKQIGHQKSRFSNVCGVFLENFYLIKCIITEISSILVVSLFRRHFIIYYINSCLAMGCKKLPIFFISSKFKLINFTVLTIEYFNKNILQSFSSIFAIVQLMLFSVNFQCVCLPLTKRIVQIIISIIEILFMANNNNITQQK